MYAMQSYEYLKTVGHEKYSTVRTNHHGTFTFQRAIEASLVSRPPKNCSDLQLVNWQH